MNIRVTKTTHPMELTPSDKLGFGIHYTDHMFIMDYSDEKGWYDPRIIPFQNISLSPAACVFHYGAEVFEGLKAYRRPDGGVQLFRPWDNMERLKNSCIRMGLPVVPPEDALEAVKALVKVDERFVPPSPAHLSIFARSCSARTQSWACMVFTRLCSSWCSPLWAAILITAWSR